MKQANQTFEHELYALPIATSLVKRQDLGLLTFYCWLITSPAKCASTTQVSCASGAVKSMSVCAVFVNSAIQRHGLPVLEVF